MAAVAVTVFTLVVRVKEVDTADALYDVLEVEVEVEVEVDDVVDMFP